MARYFTDREKAKIQGWLLELQAIIPDRFIAKRDRARELVALLDENPTHPACLIADEFGRLRRIWRRLDAQAD
jgi:hypothetical protein